MTLVTTYDRIHSSQQPPLSSEEYYFIFFRFPNRDLPDFHGKVFIVTGSNAGIGRARSRPACLLPQKRQSLHGRSGLKRRPVAAMDGIITSSSTSRTPPPRQNRFGWRINPYLPRPQSLASHPRDKEKKREKENKPTTA